MPRKVLNVPDGDDEDRLSHLPVRQVWNSGFHSDVGIVRWACVVGDSDFGGVDGSGFGSDNVEEKNHRLLATMIVVVGIVVVGVEVGIDRDIPVVVDYTAAAVVVVVGGTIHIDFVDYHVRLKIHHKRL